MRFDHRRCCLITLFIFIFCISTTLTDPHSSAQTLPNGDSKVPAPATTTSAKLRVIDVNSDFAEALMPQAGVDQQWVHGNNIHLEDAPVVSMAHYGYGSHLTIGSGPPGTGAWVHFSVPTPRRIDGGFSSLNRVMVVYNGDAKIDRIDVWDAGHRRIVAMPVNLTGNSIAFLEFSPAEGFSFGIGISVHVILGCGKEFCDSKTMLFTAAGADFTR
jgi:hypothetical protein